MPVEIVNLDEIPGQIAKGFSVYHRMSEWAEAVNLLPRIKKEQSLQIAISKESTKLVHCARPSQIFANNFRKYLRRSNRPFRAWARGGMVYIAHAVENVAAGMPQRQSGAKKTLGIQTCTGQCACGKPLRHRGRCSGGGFPKRQSVPPVNRKTIMDDGLCPYCVDPVGPRAASPTCGKSECAKKYRNEYAKKLYHAKQKEKKTAPPAAARPRDGANRERVTFANAGHGEEVLHTDLPADSEHGKPFTAGELRGMEPIEAMIHFARRHGNRLEPEKAARFFAVAGTFGISNQEHVEDKLVALIRVGAAQKFFNPVQNGVAFELREGNK